MRSKTFKYLIWLTPLLVAVLACSTFSNLTSGGNLVSSPEPTTEPTETPDERFFTEEFDGQLSDWHDEIIGDGGVANTTVVDGQFVFDIETENTYAYTFYDAQTYTDVKLSADVVNLGHEDNYFTLVCRDNAAGWYEFNVASDGYWSINGYDAATGNFDFLDNGTSELINLGLSGNQFDAVCQGNQLSLTINGELISTVTDDRFAEGKIGISVAAFDNLPISVAFERLQVSQP